MLDHWIEQQRQIQPDDRESNVIFSSPIHFQSYNMGLNKAAVRPTELLSEEEVAQAIASYDPQDNIVPVGIVHARGEWLRDYEVDENIKAKKKGRRMNKAYERIDIYSASVLKEKVYSGEVTFVTPANLYHIGDRPVRAVYLDAADGSGFHEVTPGGSFTVQYTSEGEKGIAVKFSTDEGEVLSYSVLDVVTLEIEQPDMVFNLNGPVNGRSLLGGEAQVFMGCDGVFDRPVIIVEGFDPDNTRRIADLQDDYDDDSNVETILNANGWDVVYLNFSNGGADIRTNALVLERLIDDINFQKVGTRRIVVIGESMGGLVARYCLTDMERRGRTHQVSHYISFDSPHRGANVPVGFQVAIEQLDDSFIQNVFGIGQSLIDATNRTLQQRSRSPDAVALPGCESAS